MKAYVYYDDLGKDIRVEEIPEDMQELAEKYRSELIEAIAENDAELMMKYLDGEELTIPEMKVAIRKETIANTIVPVVCGTSYKNKGVQKLLDAIVAVSYTHLDVYKRQLWKPSSRAIPLCSTARRRCTALAFRRSSRCWWKAAPSSLSLIHI